MATEPRPDEPALREARRERAFAAMDEHDLDVLVLGRIANMRYVSGVPMLWTTRTPRQLLIALNSAVMAPWAVPWVAAVVLVLATVGAVRLYRASRSGVSTPDYLRSTVRHFEYESAVTLLIVCGHT